MFKRALNRSFFAPVRLLHTTKNTVKDWDSKFGKDPLQEGDLSQLYHLEGFFVYNLDNDRMLDESSKDYKSRSWFEFQKLLEKDTMYTYID